MKKRREADPIDVVEAAYNVGVSDKEWLRTLAETVRPLIDGGAGMLAYSFDPGTPLDKLHSDPILWDLNQWEFPSIANWVSENPEFLRFVHMNNQGLLAMLDLCKRAGFRDIAAALPTMARDYAAVGVADYVALQTVEPGGAGVVIAAGQKTPRSFDARTRRVWNRVNTHIAAGRRLRYAMKQGTAPEEAILKPNGTVEHAEGETTERTARTALSEAVLRVEKARGKQRKVDPEAATEAWTAMVSGRWSLVDRFEANGRRYIVARRNEHSLPDPRALTKRERAIVHLATLGKSNKLIGYELGLSESTIGSHLSQAMRKLGTKSRVELIQLIAALGIEPET